MLTVIPAALGVATLIAATDPLVTSHGTSCAVESRPASIVKAVQPEYPELARLQYASGSTIVRVTLDDGGRLLSTAVEKTSGSKILDAAALRATKEMTFAPAIQACKTVTGSYAVEVNFVE